MGKNKLAKFEENLHFPNLFQVQSLPDSPDAEIKGKWRTDFFKNPGAIVVELGCGKGDYTIGLSRNFPEKNFIGVDIKGARLWRGCKTASEEGLKNVAFVRTRIEFIDKIFAEEEVDEIWITFPDPQPQKENKRLTSENFLNRYRTILKKGGIINFKTDDTALFEYTVEEVVKKNNYPIHDISYNVYTQPAKNPAAAQFQTFYEQMWLEEGKTIRYIAFSLN